MANSTFSGPVRSENGFKTIDVNSDTGAETDGLVINADGNIFTDAGAHTQYVAAIGQLFHERRHHHRRCRLEIA